MAKNFKTKKLDRTNNGRMLAFFLWWMATALAIVSVWVFAQEAPEDGDESLVIEIGTDFELGAIPDNFVEKINEIVSNELDNYSGQVTALLADYVKTGVVNDLQTQVSNLSGQTNTLSAQASALSAQASALSNQMNTLSDQMSTAVQDSELTGKIENYISSNACNINNIISNGVCRPE